MKFRLTPTKNRFALLFIACVVTAISAPLRAEEISSPELPAEATSPETAAGENSSATPHIADAAEIERIFNGLPAAPTRIPQLRISKPILNSTPRKATVKNEPAKANEQARIVQVPKVPSDESVWQVARRLNMALPLARGRIVIWKSRRCLELWNGPTLVKSFRVALGANPVGAKQQQGDRRTPEGEFFLCTRNAETSAFHIFLGLSYPALPDAKRGVQAQAISAREFQIIRQQLASRSAPLWRTRLGGWVGIHGGTGSRFATKRAQERGRNDWTGGCIALTDREIEEIYSATRLGTPVSIRP